MDDFSADGALAWLALSPTNQWFAAFVAGHVWMAIGILMAIAAILLFSRALLHPTLPTRFPRGVWAADLIIVPLFIMIAGSLIELALIRLGFLLPGFWVDAATSFFFFIALAWLIARGLDLFFWRGWIERRTGYRVTGLVRGLSYGTLIIVVIIGILAEAGYSLTGLVVSTGIAAAVVALALQNTLSDFFSGMALSVERSYGIDDWVELDDGTLGQVIDIGWRSTQLLSFNSSTYIVPNSRLAKARIHNLSTPEKAYAAWYDFKLPAEIEPAMAKRMITNAVTRVRQILHDPSPKVRLADASTVPYRYMIYVHFTDFIAHFTGRDAMFREIDVELRRYGLQPASTTQEIQFSRRASYNVQPSTVADALKTVDLFSILAQEEIDRLAGAADFATFDAEEEVIHQGARVDAIYVVWNGILKSHFTTRKGARIDIEELSIGDSFGQISVVTAGRSLINVTALTESILIRIRVEAVADLINARPELAERFAKIVKNRMTSMERAEAISDAGRMHSLPRTRSEIMNRIQTALFGAKTKR